MKKRKRVVVGMSGGVDSSVAAALLKKRGYEVIGITMQLLPSEESKKSSCCNLGAVTDAKRVAEKLNIPHYTINCRDPFETHVIQDFIESYAKGLTPNPCIACNRYIKFDELWKAAKDLNADFMATGHYCKITKSPKTGRYFLKKAKDPAKDQSYFLYMIPQETLSRTLFPLGNFFKPEIRAIAESLGLINAQKPDSQEICFVSQKSYKDYVKTRIPDSRRVPGDIVDTSGKVLGKHEGIYQFTIGQRKGLNISAPNPLYVLKIDPKTHTVTTGDKGERSSSTISLKTVTLIDEKEPVIGSQYTLKLRYQMTPVLGKVLTHETGKMDLSLPIPQDFISPGQSCVLYKGDRIVGGGVLTSA